MLTALLFLAFPALAYATGPSSVSCAAPSNSIVDVGQYETLGCSWSWAYLLGATGSVSQNAFNSGTPAQIVGTSSASGLTSATTTASWTFAVNSIMQTNSPIAGNIVVNDGIGNVIASAASATFTVNPTLVAGVVTMSNSVVDNGQYDTFTANPSGGTVGSGYNYLWYSGTNPTTCTSESSIPAATSSTYTTQPVSGNYYCVRITDSASIANVMYSATNNPTVNAALTATSIVSSNSLADQGQYELITYTITGGSTTYTYNIMVSNTANALPILFNSITAGSSSLTGTLTGQLPTTYNSLGTIQISGNVVDSAPTNPSVILTNSITVNALLQQGNVVASNAIVDQGQYETITAVWPATGTYPLQGNVMVANSADANPIIGNSICASSGTVFTCAVTFQTQVASNDLGTITYSSNIIDSASSPATNVITNTITFNKALVPGVVTMSNTIVDNGQYVTFTANPSKGTVGSGYNYLWYSGLSSTCTSDSSVPAATSSTYTIKPVSGNYYCVRITDSATTPNVMYSATNAPTINTPTFTLKMTPSNSVAFGNSVTINALVASSSGAVSTWQWSDNGQNVANTAVGSYGTSNVAFLSPGTYVYTVNVLDTGTSPSSFLLQVTNTLVVGKNSSLSGTSDNPGSVPYYTLLVITFNGVPTINNQSAWSLYVNSALAGTTNSIITWSEQNKPGNYNFVFSNPGNGNYVAASYSTSLTVGNAGSGGGVYGGGPGGGATTSISSTSISTTSTAASTTIMATTTIMQPKQNTTATLNISNSAPEEVNFSAAQTVVTIYTNSSSPAEVEVLITNVTANSTSAPTGFDKLLALDLSVTSAANVSVNVTANIPCSAPQGSIAPYKLINGTWVKLTQYSINAAACTIEFVVPPDPTVAILEQAAAPTTTIQAATTTIPAATTTTPNNYNVIIAIVLIIVVVAIIYFLIRGRGPKK